MASRATGSQPHIHRSFFVIDREKEREKVARTDAVHDHAPVRQSRAMQRARALEALQAVSLS